MIIEEYREEFIFLEKLRRSGVVNMFGARPYLIAEFGMNKLQARYILDLWFRNYDEKDYEGI